MTEGTGSQSRTKAWTGEAFAPLTASFQSVRAPDCELTTPNLNDEAGAEATTWNIAITARKTGMKTAIAVGVQGGNLCQKTESLRRGKGENANQMLEGA